MRTTTLSHIEVDLDGKRYTCRPCINAKSSVRQISATCLRQPYMTSEPQWSRKLGDWITSHADHAIESLVPGWGRDDIPDMSKVPPDWKCNCALQGDPYKAPEQHAQYCPYRIPKEDFERLFRQS